MKYFKKSILSIIVAFLFMGCIPQNQAALYGTYTADYDMAIEKLKLNDDGTFVHEVTVKSNSKYNTVEGTWKFDSSDGYVHFEGFMVLLDIYGNLETINGKPQTGPIKYATSNYWGDIVIGNCDHRLFKKDNSKRYR